MIKKTAIWALIGIVVPVVFLVASNAFSQGGFIEGAVRISFLLLSPGYVLSVLLFDLESTHWFDISVGCALNGIVYALLSQGFARISPIPMWVRSALILSGAAIWIGGLYFFF